MTRMPDVKTFDGFQLGYILSAILFAIGAEGLLKTLAWPMANLLITIFNYLNHTGRFGAPEISTSNMPWILTLPAIMGGILLITGGLRFARWLDHGAASGPGSET